MIDLLNPGNTDWASLETDVTADGRFMPPTARNAGKDAKTIKHPCAHCGGTGTYLHFGKCYACNGKGFFRTSERERAEARQRNAAKKAQNLADTRKVFDDTYPGVAEFIVSAASWSSFCSDLSEKLLKYGSVHDHAAAAVQRMMAKCAAKKAERETAKHAGDAVVNLQPIRTMFETAVAGGYKKPIYRAAGLVISRAPDYGRNPGALYVTDADTEAYLGKILGTNYTGKPAPGLAAIAADPKGEAVKYGQRTGTCSCCGRTLTKHASIEAGIGPICAAKWGL